MYKFHLYIYIYIYINARFYAHPQMSAHLAIGFFFNKPLSGINAHGQLFEHIIWT